MKAHGPDPLGASRAIARQEAGINRIAAVHHIWVCSGLDLVVVPSPGLYENQVENDAGLLRLVVDAVVQSRKDNEVSKWRA